MDKIRCYCGDILRIDLRINHKKITHLVAGPAFEAVGVKLVDMENVNSALDAEVVELARHF